MVLGNHTQPDQIRGYVNPWIDKHVYTFDSYIYHIICYTCVCAPSSVARGCTEPTHRFSM